MGSTNKRQSPYGVLKVLKRLEWVLPQKAVSVWGLESFEKPWIALDLIQDLEILEFNKVVLTFFELYFGRLKLFLAQLSLQIIA